MKIDLPVFKKPVWSKLIELDGHHAVKANWGDFPSSLLEATTMRVEYLQCEEGRSCSMFVIIDGDGEYIGTCSDEEEKCYSRWLSPEATIIYRLNYNSILNLIAAAISCDHVYIESIGNYDKLWKIGHINSQKNYRFPVFVYLGNALYGLESGISTLILQNYQPFLLVVPINSSITHIAYDAAVRAKSQLIGLDDLIQVHDNEIKPMEFGKSLIKKWIRAITPELHETYIAYRFPTPSGATWEQVVIEFTSREVCNVKCGNAQRRLEPEQLSMKNPNTGKPTNQWTLLQVLAVSNGRLDWKNKNAKNCVKKQKQELSRKLRETFQIHLDPIVWDKKQNCYQCKFIIRAAPNIILA